MAVQTPDTKEEQDSAYNPGDLHAAERFGSSSTSAGVDQAEAFANDPKNASEKLKDKEETPDEIPFTGSGSTLKKQSIKGKIFGSVKKNSAVTSIIGLLLTGAFGLSLLSPGLLIVQLKETMADKFNDQLATMDLRQTAILKKKLSKTTTSGVCGKTLTIRCKYQTLGDRHLKRLEKAGIKVVGEKNVFGRTRPVNFEFEGKSITAPQLLNEARNSPSLRSAMRHGYNPKFAAFSDAIAAKVNTKLGLKKSKNITPSSDKDKMKQQLKDNASGKTAAGDGAPTKYTKADDTEGYKDAAGNEITKNQYEALEAANNEIKNRASLADDIKKAGLKAGIKGALTSTAFGAGAADSLCTAWVVIRVAGFAAKVYGQRQLIRYSYQFMNTADAIKAGDATPEEVAYLSDILTSTNSEGRSATDSHGYRYAAYSDIFSTSDFDTSVEGDQLTDAATDKNVIQNETSKYVNGQILPDNLMSKVVSALKQTNVSAADDFCGTVKSWQGQVAIFTLAVGGLIAAFFTGGGTLGVGVALQVAASVVASVVLAVITPKLIDMAKGEMITGDENGNEAGNAITSGMGGYNAQTSQGRGLAVLDKQDAVEYARITETTVADYAEVERSELSPFDTSSKHTFLGSIANTLIPYTSKMGSGGSTVSSMASLVTHSLSGLATPKTNATDMTTNELNSCEDYEYKGLAADPFCNLRYGMSKDALATDPEAVLDYMEKGKYIAIDSEDGTPGGENGSQYQEYIDQCIERESSIGDNLSNDEGAGENCTQGKGGGDEYRNTMFRLFYIDMSIQEGMDTDFSVADSGVSTGAGAEFRIGTFNICYGVAVDGGYATCANGVEYMNRLTKSVKIIKDNDMQVVGLQEVRSNQWEALQSPDMLGSDYDIFPKPYKSGGYGAQNPIIWNKNDFELVKGKSIGGYTVTSGYDKAANIQVKLRHIENGQEFYVINMHEPVGTNNATDAKYRTESATARAEYVKDLAATDDLPIFITGDFNSKYKESGPGVNQTGYNGTRENLPYCILTNDTGLWDAWDAKDSRTGKCPSPDYNGSPGPVDHIYTSTEVEVSSYKLFGAGVASNGSDHNTLYADVVIPGSGGGMVRAASYNILGASHTPDSSWQDRLDTTEKIIKGSSTDGTPVGVAGLQETQKVQRAELLDRLGSYDVYPKDTSVDNPIIWDSGKYSFVSGGLMPKLQYFSPGYSLQAPWVKLRAKGATGSISEFYVLNTHDPAKGFDKKRYDNALQHVEFIKTIKSDGIPIIFTGDFNSGFSLRHGTGNDTYQDKAENLTYCILTKDDFMFNVFDLSEKRSAKCPNEGNSNSVDHIYVSKDVKLIKYQRITKSGSDHDTHIADLDLGFEIEGTGTSTTGSNIGGDDYAKECRKYLSSSDCTGECVGFVKFRLVKHGVISNQPLGNGKYVVGTLGRLGFKVDRTPAVNSVMSRQSGGGGAGHTAMVSKVNSDGSIVIEEYNGDGTNSYGTTTLTKAQYSNGDFSFAHTEGKYK